MEDICHLPKSCSSCNTEYQIEVAGSNHDKAIPFLSKQKTKIPKEDESYIVPDLGQCHQLLELLQPPPTSIREQRTNEILTRKPKKKRKVYK